MMIWQIVADALSDLNIPAAVNVMIMPSGSVLPDQFIVYQLVSAPPIVHVDDDELMRQYRVQVSLYSRSGFSNEPDLVKWAMKDSGFTRGPMREISYNAETRHFGLAMEFIYTTDDENAVEESY